MKYGIYLMAILIAALSYSVHAQDYDFEESPQPRKGIFGGGIGANATWYRINTDELNTYLGSVAMPELSENGIFLFGGYAQTYILIIPNVRLSVVGAGGSASANRTSDGFYYETDMKTSFWGASLEYVIPIRRFHIAVGILAGSGSNVLRLTKLIDGTRDWPLLEENVTSPNDIREEFRYELHNAHFAYQPMVTVEYELLPFLIAHLTGGYYGMSGTTWKLDDKFRIEGTPDFKFSAPFIRLSLTAGLFIGE